MESGGRRGSAFLRATTFAVSVLTSYQAVSQKPSWLMQLVEDLTDLKMLTLQWLKYVELRDFDRAPPRSSSDHLLPYLLTLLRKFICDCTDYQLRQDVVGEAPRTDFEWIRFSDIGNKLAYWMQVLWRAEVKCSKVDAFWSVAISGITGDAGNKILDNYEASLESQHQARTDNQQMVSDSSVNSAPNAAPTGVMIPVSDGPKPLKSLFPLPKKLKSSLRK
ncbi:hypothetical protein GQ600_9533 [Phytophthora cactorum]|nr:hypothetical protein GQ600_9533 [Phytophthora cactorum]